MQLPGEGDPTRAKAVIQAGGQLELKLVEDPTAYASESEALVKHGGVLPPGTELVPGRSERRTATGAPDTGESWYLLSRAPVVTGRDLRSATENRNTNNPGQFEVNFQFVGRRRETVRSVYGTEQAAGRWPSCWNIACTPRR